MNIKNKQPRFFSPETKENETENSQPLGIQNLQDFDEGKSKAPIQNLLSPYISPTRDGGMVWDYMDDN